MLAVVASDNAYLGARLSQMVVDEAIRQVRSADINRILREVKKPERMLIVDMEWEAVQKPGVLRQIVNVSRITGNKVICICPNQDEDLKKLSRSVRADEVFIRYDLEGAFKDFLKTVPPTPKS